MGRIAKQEMTLSEIIQSRRSEMNFTLRDVERLSEGKISYSYLSRLEMGEREDPSVTILLAICAVLAVPISEMLYAIDPIGYHKATGLKPAPTVEPSRPIV